MKKHIIQILFIISFFTFLCSCNIKTQNKAGLYTYEGEYISWEKLCSKGYFYINDNILKNVWYSSDSNVIPNGKLVLPDTINVIGKGAFENHQKWEFEIFIPNTVTTIESRAFINCFNLKGVEFEENSQLKSIESLSFLAVHSMKKLFIPKSVDYIDKYAFGYGLSGSLEEIIVEEGNTKYDSRNNCNALIETETDKIILGCENTIFPKDIKIIGEEAFYASKIKNVNLHELTKLHTIEGDAFTGCENIETIIFPDSLKIIKPAFKACLNLKTIVFPKSLILDYSNGYSFDIGRIDKICNIVLPETITPYLVMSIEEIMHNDVENLNLYNVTDEDISQWFYYIKISDNNYYYFGYRNKISIFNQNEWSYVNGTPTPIV